MKVDVAASAGEAHPGEPPRGGPASVGLDSRWLFGSAAAAIAIVAGLVLRFVAPPHLWLDEALTVNIAQLPLDQLRGALEHDGAPPLFFVLLHGWIALFGASDGAARALAGVIGCIAVGMAYVAGARFGRTPGERRWLGVAAMVVVATSPYAIRYSSEARMYSLVVALVFAGIALVADLWSAASRWRSGALAVVTAGLLYTQYWSLFLLATVAVALLIVMLRRPIPDRRRARRVLAAIAAGCVLFLPWVPTLRTQLAHTGTPWDAPARPFASTWHSIVAFGGGRSALGGLLTGMLVGLGAVAVVGRKEHLTRSARQLVAVGAATLGVAITVSVVTESGVQDRYAAVVFPFVALTGAVGIAVVRNLRARVAVLAVVAAVGLVSGFRASREVRTASGSIARAIVVGAGAGDVVAYCPDQLGPSTARLLESDRDQVVFPNLDRPEFVDWTDYASRTAAGSPVRFARRVDERAGQHRVWLVWSPGYRTLGTKCESVINALTDAGRRATKVRVASGPNGERVELRRFDR